MVTEDWRRSEATGQLDNTNFVERRTLLKALGATSVASGLSTPAIAAADDHDGSFDVVEATATDIRTALENGCTTVRKVVDQYLERIDAYDDELNAILTVNPNARNRADELDTKLDKGEIIGPLHGIPTILKDNQDTKDMPTTGAAVTLEDSMAPADAFVVKRMREAGAIILANGSPVEWFAGEAPPADRTISRMKTDTEGLG